MKAIFIEKHGDIGVLKYGNFKDPIVDDTKVIVQIKSAAINHLDIWVRNGLPGINIPLPLVLGSDASGVIVDIGKNVEGFSIKDEVIIQPGTFDSDCAFVKQGKENYSSTYGILGETENGVQSEFVSLNPVNIRHKPEHLTFQEAASMQLVFMTAYQMLVTRAKISNKEDILVYGATSGVGSAAIQISKYYGLNVYTTVGDINKIEYAKRMGADYVFNHSDENWYDDIKENMSGKQFNVIFEHIGLKTWANTMKLLGKGGRVVTCGATTGSKIDIDLRHLFMKQQTIMGSTMSNILTFNEVTDKIKKKVFFPFIDKVFTFSDIKKAHLRMENREHCGKIVLIP